MKMMKILVALLVLAGLVAPVVAIAEDKLSMSGEFYVIGNKAENYGDFNGKNDADNVEFFNQRLRLYSKYAVTEGVTIHTRMDFGESPWGDEGQNSVRFDNTGGVVDGEFQLDRAFLEIKKGAWNLRAGQQYYGFGNSLAVDHQGTGFRLAYAGPVTVTAIFNKINENGSLSDVNAPLNADEDQDIYGGSVKYKNDAFAVEGYYVVNDNKATDADPSVLGVAASAMAGPVSLKGELMHFDGDNGAKGAAKVDFIGTQLYVEGSAAASDALTLGAIFNWAEGTDQVDEAQLPFLTDFTSNMPWEHGYMATDLGIFGSGTNDVNDPFGLNAGVIALQGYADFAATDDLGLKFSVQYGTEQEDGAFEYTFMNYNASAQYTIAENTFFQVQGNILQRDAENSVTKVKMNDDQAEGIFAKLLAKF